MEERVAAELEAFREDVFAVRRAYAQMLERFAYLERSGVLVEAGLGKAERAFAELTGMHSGDAKAAVRQMGYVFPRPATTGEILETRIPATKEAFLDGRIPAASVVPIGELTEKLPPTYSDEDWVELEQQLAEDAENVSTARLQGTCSRILEYHNQDGVEPSDDLEKSQEANRLNIRWSRNKHGRRLKFDGDVDQLTGEKLLAALTPFTKPRPKDENDEPDPRSLPKRNADGLMMMLNRCLNSGKLPDVGNDPVSVFLMVTIDHLREGTGNAELDSGDLISIRDARRHCCDGRILPVVLGTNGTPIDMGRAEYAANRSLRRALRKRDGGCAHPHCHLKPADCEVHHIVHWLDGGPTIYDNCVLLCDYHHTLVHNGYWDVDIPAPQAKPVFTPPGYLHREPWVKPERQLGASLPRPNPPLRT